MQLDQAAAVFVRVQELDLVVDCQSFLFKLLISIPN